MARKNRNDLVVMVVDDTASMRHYLIELLRQNGADRILEAADGVQALKLMGEAPQRIDIVFCDLAMPKMDGVDTLRRIALAHPEISVVVFSGLDPRISATVAEMSETQGLEVLGVLGKPFSAPEVASLLERWRTARRSNARVRRAELTTEEIEAALAEDRIEIYYQPKARFCDGEVPGVEALMRLRDPHLGVLSPASFLPAAEAGGLMPALTRRVFEKAIEQAGRWAADGLPLEVALNLSPQVLRRLELVDFVVAAANRHRVPLHSLTLEITETHLDLTPEMLHNAARLRINGFKLSVDDFGTGDSGIARLRSLPFTELKIDRSFVSDMETREDLRTLLQTSIDLGHRLRMQVVAEGVEHWDQWRLLEGYGCDLAQGYLYSPPMPAGQIPDGISDWKTRLRADRLRPSESGPH